MSKIIPKTLLVVKNRAMGDAVMGLGTVQYLKQLYPQAYIIYAVPKWIKPLFDNVKTSADEIISLELKNLGDFFSLWKNLRKRRIDTVFELFQSGRTAKFFNLWSKLGGPQYVFHNHHTNEGKVFEQGTIKSNIQRDLDGAWTFFDHINETPPSYLNYEPKLKVNNQTRNNKKTIVLGVVATRETKMWAFNNYKKFVHLFLEEFKDYKILIPLGPKDEAIEKEFTPLLSERCEILKEPLSKLISALDGASLYLGNDTGLKHICVALGMPSFTLFGPEPPNEWHPYDVTKHSYYYREGLECRTRNAHYCGLSQCDSMICLNEFKPSQLLEHCRENLNFYKL